ncbi:MAG: hypothetical protein ACSHX8_15765 [Opitutaceae bacterium]
MKWILPLTAMFFGVGVGYLLFDESDATESSRSVQSEKWSVRSTERVAGSSSSEDETSSVSATSAAVLSEGWLLSLDEKDPIEQYAAISQALAGLSPSDYPRIMSELSETKSSMGRRVLEIVRREWATTDPRGMLAYASSLKQDESESLQRVIFMEWARVDFDQAWAQVTSMPDGSLKKYLERSVVNGAASENPMKVLSLLNSGVIPRRQSHYYYGNVFQAIAKEDSALARQMAADMPEGEAKKYALAGSLRDLANDDFGAALDWLDQLPAGSSVHRARKDILQGLRSKDFASIRALVESEADPERRQLYLENMQLRSGSRSASFDEVLEMYAWVDTHATGRTRQNQMSQVVYALAESDMSRATEFALELPYGNMRSSALRSLASRMAQEDLELVIQFAESLPYEDEREQVLGGISYQVMKHGVESASAFVLENDHPELQRRMVRQLVQEWAVFDRGATLDWMAQLTDQKAFGYAQSELLKVWGEDDPQGAVNYIESEVEESKRASAYKDIISKLAYEDPQAAIAWLDNLPETEVNTEKSMYQRITYAYMEVDSLAASEWVASLESGDLRDASVKALAEKVVRYEPDSAFVWANSVDDAQVRKDVQKRTIREWAKKDLSAAYQAVRDARIEAEEKEPLFKEIEAEQKRQETGSSEVSWESPVMLSVVN